MRMFCNTRNLEVDKRNRKAYSRPNNLERKHGYVFIRNHNYIHYKSDDAE